jgi:hypothetical protein
VTRRVARASLLAALFAIGACELEVPLVPDPTSSIDAGDAGDAAEDAGDAGAIADGGDASTASDGGGVDGGSGDASAATNHWTNH